MNSTGQNEQNSTQIKTVLDAGLEHLDPSISTRLRQGRIKALEQTQRKPFQTWFFMHPRQLIGIATAAILLLMVTNWRPLRPSQPENRVEELELVAQQGSLEMYKDLDFYRWLAKNDAAR